MMKWNLVNAVLTHIYYCGIVSIGYSTKTSSLKTVPDLFYGSVGGGLLRDCLATFFVGIVMRNQIYAMSPDAALELLLVSAGYLLGRLDGHRVKLLLDFDFLATPVYVMYGINKVIDLGGSGILRVAGGFLTACGGGAIVRLLHGQPQNLSYMTLCAITSLAYEILLGAGVTSEGAAWFFVYAFSLLLILPAALRQRRIPSRFPGKMTVFPRFFAVRYAPHRPDLHGHAFRLLSKIAVEWRTFAVCPHLAHN